MRVINSLIFPHPENLIKINGSVSEVMFSAAENLIAPLHQVTEFCGLRKAKASLFINF